MATATEMVQDYAATVELVTSEAVRRRMPGAKWLSLIHHARRKHAASFPDQQPIEPLTVLLLDRILAATVLDPLLVEYLSLSIYGSPAQSGTNDDECPLCDVLSTTLAFIAQLRTLTSSSTSDDKQTERDRLVQSISALETISSVLGQALLLAFSPPGSFNAEDPDFHKMIAAAFVPRHDGPSSPTPTNSDVPEAIFAFLHACLLLVQLASKAPVPQPANLLAPRIAVTLLSNTAPGLLLALLKQDQTKSSSTFPLQAAGQVHDLAESALETMNPSWENEIALLRTVASQISQIRSLVSQAQDASAKPGNTDTDASSSAAPAQVVTDGFTAVDQLPTFDHFIDVAALANADTSNGSGSSENRPSEPEVALLLHRLLDERISWIAKLEAVKMLFLARRADAAPSVTLDQSLTAFYYELLSAAVETCASVVQSPPSLEGRESSSPVIWRNAVCGLVPEVIAQLEQWLDASPDLVAQLRGERTHAPHMRVETVLLALLVTMSERLTACEAPHTTNTTTTVAAEDVAVSLVGTDTPLHEPVRAWLLRSLIEAGLARPEAVTDEFPAGHKLAEEVQALSQSLRMDAQLEGLDMSTFFDGRLADDPEELLNRVATDPGVHAAFAQQLLTHLAYQLDAHDLEAVSRICRALQDDQDRLDVLTLYLDPADLASLLSRVLEQPDLALATDDPATLAHILIFLQLLPHRYSIPPASLGPADAFFPRFLRSPAVAYRLADLGADERALVSRWISALFDNEGIADDLIRDSSPRTLLRLAPTLFAQSLAAHDAGVIDADTLRGGLSYFHQDLLLYTLPGALRWIHATQRTPHPLPDIPTSVLPFTQPPLRVRVPRNTQDSVRAKALQAVWSHTLAIPDVHTAILALRLDPSPDRAALVAAQVARLDAPSRRPIQDALSTSSSLAHLFA